MKRKVQKIEAHLRNYHQYKIGINNLKLQLESIMPKMTASYELCEGSSGSFIIISSTEQYAIDRIESKRALDLHEQIETNKIITTSIDNALDGLDIEERKIIECRYFYHVTIQKMAMTLGYSESTVFKIRNRIMMKLIHSLHGLTHI
ncbi:sigma-70 family RNA polymerase sigma factor [Neobacillus cucumis]|nr:sigma-70 family RNA polymerase sigma factor [Neobacillus cucumis]